MIKLLIWDEEATIDVLLFCDKESTGTELDAVVVGEVKLLATAQT
jgi:hypothetical protein